MLRKKREKCKSLRFENATFYLNFSKLNSSFTPPPTFIVLTWRIMQQRSWQRLQRYVFKCLKCL